MLDQQIWQDHIPFEQRPCVGAGPERRTAAPKAAPIDPPPTTTPWASQGRGDPRGAFSSAEEEGGVLAPRSDSSADWHAMPVLGPAWSSLLTESSTARDTASNAGPLPAVRLPRTPWQASVWLRSHTLFASSLSNDKQPQPATDPHKVGIADLVVAQWFLWFDSPNSAGTPQGRPTGVDHRNPGSRYVTANGQSDSRQVFGVCSRTGSGPVSFTTGDGLASGDDLAVGGSVLTGMGAGLPK